MNYELQLPNAASNKDESKEREREREMKDK